MASGEFRTMDVDTAIDVIMAPLLMLAISRFSLGFCSRQTSAEVYLQTHFDLLLNGLRPIGETSATRRKEGRH